MGRARPVGDRPLDALFAAIRAVARKIPKGRVATYGQLAELAGLPGGARVAAAAMKTLEPRDRVPWQRVLGKAGRARARIAIHDPVGAAMQRQLLEAEGVIIGDTGLVPLDRYGWIDLSDPRPRGATATAGSDRGASPRRQPRSASKSRASSSRR